MGANRSIVALTALALAAASSPAMAQRWGRGPQPREGACFFEDANYRGEYFCVGAGESLNRLPSGMNDRISSIKVFGRVEVSVFKDAEFEGRSRRFSGDVRNVGDDWNDLISSIRIRGNSSGFGGGSFGRPGNGDPDRIVRRAYQDILNREPDSAGLRLYRSRIIDDGWSEEQVRDALRNSPEYRERSTMTYAKAEEIVRRAYLSVLKREPDGGSRGYVDKVFRDHWSQQDVERELRKSDEYRRKG